MRNYAWRWSNVSQWLQWSLMAVFVTLVLPRNVNSLSIWVFALMSTLSLTVPDRPKPFFIAFPRPLLVLVALFLIYLISTLAHEWNERSAPELIRKLPLALLPLFWWLGRMQMKDVGEIAHKWFSSTLAFIGLFMMLESSIDFARTRELDAFFYHRFSAPANVNAIYFAWMLAIAVLWPDRENRGAFGLRIKLWLMVLLLLTASKLIITTTIFLLIIRVIRDKKWLQINRWTVASIALVTLLLVPVSLRFSEIIDPQLHLVNQEKFDQSTTFNGLNLRLLQWRFGIEILNEQNAWLSGVGQTHKQAELNAKYESSNMYVGNPELGDTGYKQFNFHNQYIETLMAVGVSGLLLLILLFCLYFFVGDRSNQKESYTSVVSVCLLFMLTESVLERQQGVVLFALIMIFAFYGKWKRNNHEIESRRGI